MKIDYVQHWGDDLIVCNAARVSFDKETDWEGYDEHGYGMLSYKDRNLINFLAREGHTSCFEHMGATLRLKVPIFIARQIQRHRTFSYNEISRRYVDSEPEFFWPDKWRARADNVKQGSVDNDIGDNCIKGAAYTIDDAAKSVIGHALGAYKEMLDNDVAPELARMILPQNMYTEFYMSGNLRAWAHFLHLRLDAHAQKEVQDVAKMVEEILMPLFPVSMEALRNYGDG